MTLSFKFHKPLRIRQLQWDERQPKETTHLRCLTNSDRLQSLVPAVLESSPAVLDIEYTHIRYHRVYQVSQYIMHQRTLQEAAIVPFTFSVQGLQSSGPWKIYDRGSVSLQSRVSLLSFWCHLRHVRHLLLHLTITIMQLWCAVCSFWRTKRHLHSMPADGLLEPDWLGATSFHRCNELG